MVTLISSLPEKTLGQLSVMVKKIKVPKNELINLVFIKYFDAIEKQIHINSFKKLAGD